MLYSATWVGMRALAGDQPDADLRREQLRRTNAPGRVPETATSGQAVPNRVIKRQMPRLLPLLPTAR